jgi:nitronate monooxygenase
LLDEWLTSIRRELEAHDRSHPDRPAAPFAVNQIVHKSNIRLEHDLGLCVRHRVPIVITSLGAREEVNQAVHGYGGIVLHDVIHNTFAHKAVDKGADGLIAVAAGAGGHAGAISPLALIEEIREWWSGPLVLSGAISTGRGVLAAQAMGADLAYVGSAFIATVESNAAPEYKQMIVASGASDIVFQRRLRKLPEAFDRARRPRPQHAAAFRSKQDELRERQQPAQGVARHLGCGPGHRRRQGRRGCGRTGRAFEERI